MCDSIAISGPARRVEPSGVVVSHSVMKFASASTFADPTRRVQARGVVATHKASQTCVASSYPWPHLQYLAIMPTLVLEEFTKGPNLWSYKQYRRVEDLR